MCQVVTLLWMSGEVAENTKTIQEEVRMEKEKKKSKGKKALIIAGGIALTVAGFIVIPPLLDKYANKAYKSSLKKEEIDFDDMGPEIVPSKEKEEEESGD